jgi:hypothetical protein
MADGGWTAKEVAMNRMRLVGLGILLACGALPVMGAAQDDSPSLESKATIQGEVILRTPDPARGVVYLRLREDSGRVWLIAVTPTATAVTQEGLPVAHDLLKEGARVEAAFPRGTDDVPVAESVAILSPSIERER